jgi:type I restriction enzyme S subunit
MVEWKELKEVFDTRNGYTPSTSNDTFWEGGYIPWFKMEDIRDNGGILNDSYSHITDKAIKGKGLFKANSILLATSATIGEHALIEVEHLSNQRFTNFYPKKVYESRINMRYAYYYMYIIDEWCKQHVNQGGFASVDMGGLYKLPFPIPSLTEQQRIVEQLDTFTSSIENLKEQIAQRRKQYEYYRNQLLDLEGKEGVEIKTLGDICKLERGVRVVKKELQVEGQIPVYQNSLTPLGYYEKSNYSAGTPFVICAGAAGDVGFSNIPFWAADDCTCIVCPNSVKSKFVYYYLETKLRFLKSQVRKASVPRLSKEVIGKLSTPIPPLSEQQRIVSILDQFEASLANLEAQLAQREKQYEYYRNKLLTFD